MKRKDSRQDSIVQHPKNRKGLSLIELIVVLGIIAGGLGVAFSYITQTEKSKDMFLYQSALKDAVLAVAAYQGAYGLESLTQDSLANSGFLPASWTPMETVSVSTWPNTMLKTANGEFLLALAGSTTLPTVRFLVLIPYKHPILVPPRGGFPREAGSLHAYCQALQAKTFPNAANCYQRVNRRTNADGTSRDGVYIQVLGFNTKYN